MKGSRFIIAPFVLFIAMAPFVASALELSYTRAATLASQETPPSPGQRCTYELEIALPPGFDSQGMGAAYGLLPYTVRLPAAQTRSFTTQVAGKKITQRQTFFPISGRFVELLIERQLLHTVNDQATEEVLSALKTAGTFSTNSLELGIITHSVTRSPSRAKRANLFSALYHVPTSSPSAIALAQFSNPAEVKLLRGCSATAKLAKKKKAKKATKKASRRKR